MKERKRGYQKDLEIKKKFYGEQHTKYATSLANYNLALFHMGDYQGAKEGYEEALEIKRKNYGEDHVEYASCLGNLAGVLNRMGDY